MPSRRIKITLRPGQVSQNLMRRCSVEADNVEAVTRRVPSLRRGLKQNLRAIGRPEGTITERGDFLFQAFSSESGNDKQAALAIFRTVDNMLSIGRPVRLPFVAGTFGNFKRTTNTYLLNPNAELAPTIGA